MKFLTRNFGEIEVNAEKILKFDEELPGFPGHTEFIIITEEGDDTGTFSWLQSLNDGNIAFILMNVFNVLPDYSPVVDESKLTALDLAADDEINVYNIVVLPEDISKMSVNLMAPVVINPRTQRGQQIILDNEEYGIRHYIFDEIKKYKNGKVGE